MIIASDDGDGANDAEKSSSTGIMYPGDPKDENLAGSGRSLRAQQYNVIVASLRDLETFLINDGTIDLIGAGVRISEVMWGTDASLDNPAHNQWIEIRNISAGQIKTDGYKLMFYEANEALPNMEAADSKISDRLSTRNWNIVGIGSSGRSSTTIGTGADVELVDTMDIVSMQRTFSTVPDDAFPDDPSAAGALATPIGWEMSAWASSERPSQNFMANVTGRVGSPGAKPINYPDTRRRRKRRRRRGNRSSRCDGF